MLNYIITIAISAFFVPHYLVDILGAASREPVGHRRRRGRDRAARRAEHRRHPGVGEAQHLPGGRRLRDAAAARAARLRARLQRVDAVANVHWGVAPTWNNFLLAIPVAMIAYTGIETVSNLAEEARDPRARSRARSGSWPGGLRDLLHAARDRAFGAARQVGRGELTTLLGLPPEEGGYQNDPMLGVVENLGITGRAPRRAADLRRHPRGDDPLHRHERGRHRRVANHVLDGLATGSCRSSSGSCTRSSRRRGSRWSCSRASSRSSCCCRGRWTSSGRCTRSARCCRSRSLMPP